VVAVENEGGVGRGGVFQGLWETVGGWFGGAVFHRPADSTAHLGPELRRGFAAHPGFNCDAIASPTFTRCLDTIGANRHDAIQRATTTSDIFARQLTGHSRSA